MNTLTVTRMAAMPRVNLLPPEIAEQVRFRRVQGGLAAAVVLALAAVGFLYFLAMNDANSAQDELATVQQQNATLVKQQASYDNVPRVYAQVDAAEARLQNAMGSEIRWSYKLNDLSLMMPTHVWLQKMSVTQTVGTPGAAASASQIFQPGVASITFDGLAYSTTDVAAWLDKLISQPGNRDAYFTNAAVQPGTGKGARSLVTFSSQVTLSERALSLRYLVKGGQAK